MVEEPESETARFERILDLIRQAIIHRQANRLEASLACLNKVLNENPELHALNLTRAETLLAQGEYEAAWHGVESYEQATGRAGDTQALRTLIRESAAADFSVRLTREPDDVPALRDKAAFLLATKDFQAAEATCARLLARSPDDEQSLFRYAYVLAELGRPSEALIAYAPLLEAFPAHPLGWFNSGILLQQMHRLDEAKEALAKAADLHSNFAEAYIEQAHCCLAQGDFSQGWLLYEWRWQTTQFQSLLLQSTRPRWLGQQPLDGKTLLLWSEQGLGDTLQFVRFVPRVASLARKLILLVPTTLRTLLVDLPPSIIAMDRDTHPLPEHDLHCPLMSLPLALQINTDELDAGMAYLNAPPSRVRHWEDKLSGSREPRIGLVWRGNQKGTINRTRDLPVEELAPLTRLGAQLFALHDHIRPEDLAILNQWPNFTDYSSALSNMAETAALIENLNIVLSVDTAVAHLAGALGKPCCLLLRHSGEWRWQLEQETSPWYPSIRIFRQRQPGDWTGVIDSVCQGLLAWLNP